MHEFARGLDEPTRGRILREAIEKARERLVESGVLVRDRRRRSSLSDRHPQFIDRSTRELLDQTVGESTSSEQFDLNGSALRTFGKRATAKRLKQREAALKAWRTRRKKQRIREMYGEEGIEIALRVGFTEDELFSMGDLPGIKDVFARLLDGVRRNAHLAQPLQQKGNHARAFNWDEEDQEDGT
jgi:hypothetical protein